MTCGVVQTGAGTLTLGRQRHDQRGQPRRRPITGNLDLGGATRTFTVADGPAAPDLSVTSVVSGTGAGVTKAGPGLMSLGGANSYDGATAVNAGTLAVANGSALGSTAAGTSVSNGATLQVSGNSAVGAEALTLNGTGTSSNGALESVSGTNSWAGTVSLATDSTVGVDANSLDVSGVVSGTGTGLTKIGAGILSYSGASANTYAGATNVNVGELDLNKSAGTAAFRGCAQRRRRDRHRHGEADPVGSNPGCHGRDGELVGRVERQRRQRDAQLTDDDRRLGVNDDTRQRLADPRREPVVHGHQCGGDHLGAGRPRSTTRTFSVNDGTASLDLTVSAVISGTGAGLTMTGDGTLRLNGTTGANTYTGTTTVNSGTLTLEAGKAGAVPGDVVVGDGTGSDTLRETASNGIADGFNVTVNSSGLLDLNNFSDTIGPLTMTAGSVTTGTGTLTLGADVTTNATGTTASISGHIAWGTTTNRTFTVGDGAANPDLSVSTGTQTIASAQTLTKAGLGNMSIGTLSNAGTVVVSAGTLSQTGMTTSKTVNVLSGANLTTASGVNYTQTAGTTAANGTITATGASVQINAGSLTGTGTVAPDLANAGSVVPGNSTVNNGIGILSVSGTYEQSATGTLSIQVVSAGGPGTGNDKLNVSGAVTLDPLAKLGTSTSVNPVSLGQSYTILGFSSLTGTFNPNSDLNTTNNNIFIPHYDHPSDVYMVVTAPPTVSVANVTQNPGNGGGFTPFTFTITRAGTADQLSITTTASYSTANGTAIAPGDYTAVPATQVQFGPGETTKTFDVQVYQSPYGQPSLNFKVKLSGLKYATAVQGGGSAVGQATGTILNSNPLPTSTSTTSRAPTAAWAARPRARSPSPATGARPAPASIVWKTKNGTAMNGVDYQGFTSNQTTIVPACTTSPSCVSTTTVVINVISANHGKTFQVNLAANTWVTITQGTGTGTIQWQHARPRRSSLRAARRVRPAADPHGRPRNLIHTTHWVRSSPRRLPLATVRFSVE